VNGKFIAVLPITATIVLAGCVVDPPPAPLVPVTVTQTTTKTLPPVIQAETVTVTSTPIKTIEPMNPPDGSCVEGGNDPSTWNTADDVHNFNLHDAQIVSIDHGRHNCFDQITFVIKTPSDIGYSVRYVDDEVADQASGDERPVSGGAALDVVITAFVPESFAGHHFMAGWPALREIRYLSSFEGYTQFAVGIKERTPFAAEHFRRGDHMIVTVKIAHDK